MKNWKKMIVTAAAFGALALFAGCTTASAVSLEEAKDLVKTRVGAQNAVVVEQEVDRDDGVYELEIIVDGVGYEFEVDSRTGDVREVEREDSKPRETKPASITLEEAKAIAYGHAGVPEEQSLDKSYERDDGVFEIDFVHGGWEYDYEISPDGSIVKAEKEPEPTAAAPTEAKKTETKKTEAKKTESKSSRISLEEAKAIAYGHAGVTESEAHDKSYEKDDGKYEIDFDHGGYEYEYDISYEGKILKSHKEKDHDHHGSSHHTSAPAETQPKQTEPARISAQEALSVALAHAGVSDARDKDVEWDDGRWEVSFESGNTDYEYHISAEGEVLRWEKDSDD